MKAYTAEPGEGMHEGGHGLNPLDDKYNGDTGYFLQSLASHERHGFLWQKLRMPRSFDYETTQVKRYDERLRMPKFPFDEKQARSGDDVRAWFDARSAGREVHLPAESAAASDRAGPACAGEVQLRGLPYPGYGSVGHLVFAESV